MDDTGAQQAGCACAQEYADRWPDMTPAELAHVYAGTCPVRLERMRREGRPTRRGGGAVWKLLLRQRQHAF